MSLESGRPHHAANPRVSASENAITFRRPADFSHVVTSGSALSRRYLMRTEYDRGTERPDYGRPARCRIGNAIVALPILSSLDMFWELCCSADETGVTTINVLLDSR